MCCATIQRDMMYGEARDFETAIATLKALAVPLSRHSKCNFE
jgi:hypothetical protein